jgi:hypothetical protein
VVLDEYVRLVRSHVVRVISRLVYNIGETALYFDWMFRLAGAEELSRNYATGGRGRAHSLGSHASNQTLEYATVDQRSGRDSLSHDRLSRSICGWTLSRWKGRGS